MASNVVLRGGCACNHIRYTSRTLPEYISNCFCVQCRKASGGPYQSFAEFPTSSITWLAEPKYRQSSDKARRAFCEKCGSSLVFQYNATPERISLAAGTIDDWDVKGELVKPREYTFIKEKPVWFDLPDDGLQKWELDTPEAPQNKPIN